MDVALPLVIVFVVMINDDVVVVAEDATLAVDT